MKPITVIGGGLAGCEAAWQLAKRDIDVIIVEMKPEVKSPAHALDGMAELLCSNSFRGAGLTGAVGLLKEELRLVGSLLMDCAAKTAVPAGRALAVNRQLFSQTVEAAISTHPKIKIERRRQDTLPTDDLTILASGPLTDGPLMESLQRCGVSLSYHDAIAPMISADSLDRSVIFAADRYEDNTKDAGYLNCPMNEREYFEFVQALVNAQKTPLKDFETAPFFEGCLPVEEMASRGAQTLSHGPLKPVGLIDPRTGKRPYAVVQLRKEDTAGTAYNLVGFQTRLTRPEQLRVLRTIPGMEKAVFERYGQIHRNSFVDAPRMLDKWLRLNTAPNVTLAGQITGVEGYVESIASGCLAAVYIAAQLRGETPVFPPASTALGGIARHTGRAVSNYQPSNIVWSMIETAPRARRQKKHEHRQAAAKQALSDIAYWIAKI